MGFAEKVSKWRSQQELSYCRFQKHEDGGVIESRETSLAGSVMVEEGARIAVYSETLLSPRIVDIPPQSIAEFIEAIAASTYELALQQGGLLPYSVIQELVENFIHAEFAECTISIFNGGNTIRFADQGPGIDKKDHVILPGFSSATAKMKEYIKGVGSGLSYVNEYLSSMHGFLNIEDNAGRGTVVTITVSEPMTTPDFIEQTQHLQESSANTQAPMVTETLPLNRNLSDREEQSLLLLSEHGMLGPVDLADFLNTSPATATRLFQKLERLSMVESTHLKKRILSNAGMAYIQAFLVL